MRLLILLVLIGLPFQVAAAPQCDLPEEKKKRIISILCGGAATEREYQTTGSNCVREATLRRMRDSAAQIIVLQKCDDPAFAERFKAATIKASRFIQLMSTCSQERIDVGKMLDDAVAELSTQSNTLRCDGDMQRLIVTRKPAFENMIRMSDDPSTQAAILTQLGIVADNQGNISEKKP